MARIRVFNSETKKFEQVAPKPGGYHNKESREEPQTKLDLNTGYTELHASQQMGWFPKITYNASSGIIPERTGLSPMSPFISLQMYLSFHAQLFGDVQTQTFSPIVLVENFQPKEILNKKSREMHQNTLSSHSNELASENKESTALKQGIEKMDQQLDPRELMFDANSDTCSSTFDENREIEEIESTDVIDCCSSAQMTANSSANDDDESSTRIKSESLFEGRYEDTRFLKKTKKD